MFSVITSDEAQKASAANDSSVVLRENFSEWKKPAVMPSKNDTSTELDLLPSEMRKQRPEEKVKREMKKKINNVNIIEVLKSFPYLYSLGASMFNERNVTDFLNTFEEICAEHKLSESEKIKRLHRYCTPTNEQYIRSIFVDEDMNWKKIRKLLRHKYKDTDFDQDIVTFSYLKAFKNTHRTKLCEVPRYIRKYAATSNLLRKNRKLLSRMQGK